MKSLEYFIARAYATARKARDKRDSQDKLSHLSHTVAPQKATPKPAQDKALRPVCRGVAVPVRGAHAQQPPTCPDDLFPTPADVDIVRRTIYGRTGAKPGTLDASLHDWRFFCDACLRVNWHQGCPYRGAILAGEPTDIGDECHGIRLIHDDRQIDLIAAALLLRFGRGGRA